MMSEPFIVAQIEKDHISEDSPQFNEEGREFHSEALRNWWGWGVREGTPEDTYFKLALANNGKKNFKMYDDDGELYYEGWLINDDECFVQQFVLSWGGSFAGCTTITVYKDAEAGYVQEIG